MKHIVIAAAVLSSAASAGAADVGYFRDSNTAVAYGDKGTTFHTTAMPDRGCKIEHYFAETRGSQPLQNTSIAVSFRVDWKTKWNATLELTETTDYLFGLLDGDNPKFVTELRRGNTLRVKVPQARGGAHYEGYSLRGFSVALSKVKANCKPHNDYFTRPSVSNDHATYL